MFVCARVPLNICMLVSEMAVIPCCYFLMVLFVHYANAFMQSKSQCNQAIHSNQYVFLGNKTCDLGAALEGLYWYVYTTTMC